MSEVTQILQRARGGDVEANAELLTVLYHELRRIAAAKLAQELPGQTLQPTALVHDAWLRLGADNQPAWENRAHFISAAAEAMRRILVENARRKARLKRGGDQNRSEFEEAALEAPVPDEKILAVHDALDRLGMEDPERERIVKLRFFVGLKQQEIAALLGISERTVRRQWDLAKVQLLRHINNLP